jgi:2-polyprenyl-3-methyl-5-hydroxy-6-metoxy-1,4-benzoquinol methylase
MAYADAYYTHRAPSHELGDTPASRMRRVRRSIRNGYLNHSFGLDLPDASPFGRIAAPLIPPLARRAREWAQVPRPSLGARLLDVGAANGKSVAHLRRLGWDAEGLDVDGQAVANAIESGLPVRIGRIEDEPGSAAFDAITFDHSIEHLHEPASAVRVALRLLRPGGLLWVATPNLGSLGARLYGRDWVGLDPPRHLVSFTARGMRTMLANAGFGRIRFHAPRIGGKRYWHASQGFRIAEGGSYETELPLRARIAYRVGDSQLTARWTLGEELLVTARRPLAGP